MKRKKKKRSGSQIEKVTCKNCPTSLIQSTNPHFIHAQRHGLCSACSANEIDALNEKLTLGGTVNEDVEAQNTLMVHALFFYGDKRNYGILGGTRIRVDKGQKAREALASGLSQDALGKAREALSLIRSGFTNRCPECDTVHQPLADGVLCHACTS
jgi:hypothetical protein